MGNRKPYQLVSREWKKEDTTFEVNGVCIGKELVMIAGPCAVENREQIFTISEYLSKLNVKFLRGGAYKPRTSPYSFQGLKTEGLQLLREAGDKYGLAVVSEIMGLDKIDDSYDYLLRMPIYSLTKEMYEKIKEDFTTKKEEIKILEATDPKDMYLLDLTELKKKFK